ncbi:thioesterase family protein [Streptomyces cavernae]|uniref:thioesterase family protein n=1 Tax=Streptomyces cavernae TaxID=2259034 RepID=UPI000FEBA9FD|nr:thioesterase family protein [Streptomyces cavernae]
MSHGIVTPYEGRGHGGWDPKAPIPAPLDLHRTTVARAWVDYNGHLSESCFLLIFGDGSDAFFRWVGVDEAYRAAGHSLYTAETHLRHLGEASEGDPLRLTLRLLDADEKRLHLFHAMYHENSGALLATAEQMLLHVDTKAGRVSPFPPELARRLRSVKAAHAQLPVPEAVGHVMGIPRRQPSS